MKKLTINEINEIKGRGVKMQYKDLSKVRKVNTSFNMLIAAFKQLLDVIDDEKLYDDTLHCFHGVIDYLSDFRKIFFK